MDPTCFKCGEPFYEGSCIWCTCERCGSDLSDGVCLNCNSHSYVQNSFNNSSNISDFYTPPPPSLYCYICGKPSEEGMSCGRCFCNECGCINCMCYTPSADTSFDYDPSLNNFPQNDFYEPNSYYNDESFQNAPISQQNGCEYCGGPHFSTDCQTREPFPYDNNYHDQPPQYDTLLTVQNNILKMMTAQNDFNEMCLDTINLFKEVIRMREQESETITEVAEIASSQSTPLVPPPDSSKFQFCECCMYDDDDDSTITIALNPQNESISSPVEPVDSLIMGDEPLDTTPATESDKFNTSSVEDLVPIQSEFGDISHGDSSFHPSFTPVEGSDDVIDEDDDDLVPRVPEEFDTTFTNPMFDFESDYNQISNNPIFDILSDESDMEPEVQDKHDLFDSPHEKFSDELSHTISQPDIENDENGLQRNELTEELHNDDLSSDTDSFLFDLPSSRPPAKPPDVDFELDVNEEIFGVVDEIFEHDVPVLKILPTQPTLDSEIDFAFIIWVFYPFFAYPILSSLFHSTGSEDTVFDPGISIAKWPFYMLSPRTN
jgi:hypothetical protein